MLPAKVQRLRGPFLRGSVHIGLALLLRVPLSAGPGPYKRADTLPTNPGARATR
ncbi:hypothetical protein D3C74_405260 [compost metagenome]